MAYKLHKTLVLVGMMGAGKTAVGQALAAKLAVAFYDSDQELKRAANMEISEIFERDGEAFFRNREAEIIKRLLASQPCILSTGGGAFLQDRNRAEISQNGISVWLNADLDLLWQRVRHKDTRPLLRTPDPKATLTEIYNARVPVYAMSEIQVDAKPEYEIGRMATEVVKALRARPDVIEEIK